jgi:hypothetical protein
MQTTVLDEVVSKKLEEMVQWICDQYSACLFVKKYLMELEKTRAMTGDPVIDKLVREARHRVYAPMHDELNRVLAKGPLFPSPNPHGAATPGPRETEPIHETKEPPKNKKENTR